MFSEAKTRFNATKILSYTAVLTAISALFNIFSLFIGAGGSLAVSFTYIPAFIAGSFFGPVAGLFTGLIGDLIGCWIAPRGDLNPIILVSSGLLGLLPGIVFRIAKIRPDQGKKATLATVVSMFLVLAIATNLNTFGQYLFYFKGVGKTLPAVFALRMPKQTFVWLINVIIILSIRHPIGKLIKF